MTRGPILVVLLVVLALGGCAPPGAVERTQLSSIKTIGVISAIGDSFRMYEYGGTVFHTRTSAKPIPDWKVDDEAASIAQRFLEAKGVYKVVLIPTRLHAQIREALRPTLARSMDLEAMRRILGSAQPQPPVDRLSSSPRPA